MVETGFTSYRAAMLAGRIALEEFLDKLSLRKANRGKGQRATVLQLPVALQGGRLDQLSDRPRRMDP